MMHNHPAGQIEPCPDMWANSPLGDGVSPDLNIARLRQDAKKRDAIRSAAWDRQMARALPGGDLEGKWSVAAKAALNAWNDRHERTQR